MRTNDTKEIAMDFTARFCKAEGFTSVADFREFFTYWIIGNGYMDDDFSPESKRIEKYRTVAQWKKIYAMLDDSDIEACLASSSEAEKAKEALKNEKKAKEAVEAAKSEEEKECEAETERQFNDAGLEYDPNLSWEENIDNYAINPEVKKEEISRYSGYGYHGGGRPAKEIKRNKTIGIRLTEAEYADIQSKADNMNLTISAYCLNKIIN